MAQEPERSSRRNVLARLDEERYGLSTGRFRIVDRSELVRATPHAGITPLASVATSGGALCFTSLDTLGLATHPRVLASVAETLRVEVDSGDHPSISSFRLAHTTNLALARWLSFPHVVTKRNGARTLATLLPLLVGVGDHVLVDSVVDHRIAEAVAGTSAGVTRFASMDPEGLLTRLENVRTVHPSAGILVVTQSTFPTHGESPDLGLLCALGAHYEATLLVDATHDFGCMGARGLGMLGDQGVLEHVDLVTADLSRTFGADAGFIATRSAALERLLVGASASPLPTIRAAELLAALELAASPAGDALRVRAERVAALLRAGLRARGFHVLGAEGPIVPVVIGDVDVATQIQQYLEGEGVVVELAVPRDPANSARLVFRITALHREAHVHTALDALETACAVVRSTPLA